MGRKKKNQNSPKNLIEETIEGGEEFEEDFDESLDDEELPKENDKPKTPYQEHMASWESKEEKLEKEELKKNKNESRKKVPAKFLKYQ